MTDTATDALAAAIRHDLAARFEPDPEPEIVEAIDCASNLASYCETLAQRYAESPWDAQAASTHRGMATRLVAILHSLDPEIVIGTMAEALAARNLAISNSLLAEFPAAHYGAGHA